MDRVHFTVKNLCIVSTCVYLLYLPVLLVTPFKSFEGPLDGMDYDLIHQLDYDSTVTCSLC